MKVFDVYEKASTKRGLWGVSLKANMATVVDCKDDQANVREVEASKIPTLLASKLKAGYRRVNGAYFFSEKDGQLRREHPDFAGLHLEDVVLTARPPEVLSAVSLLDETYGGLLRAVVGDRNVKDWMDQQDFNASTIVATMASPAYALMLAQAAREQGWLLIAMRVSDTIPSVPPSADQAAWSEWLANFFSRDSIAAAMHACGFSKEAQVNKNIQDAPVDDDNVAGLL